MNRRRFMKIGFCTVGMALLQPALADSEPTREMVLDFQREFLEKLEAEAYEEADAYLLDFPRLSAEKKIATLKTLIEKREISAQGLDLLARGQFGPLSQVFPERAEQIAGRAPLPVDECWAIRLEGAKACFHWKGGQLKLFFIDDIGKLPTGDS